MVLVLVENLPSSLAPTSYLAKDDVFMKEGEDGGNNDADKKGVDIYAGYWNTVS
ncbi:hypothetical protein HK100_011720 [Physocladia obscura]|uniref:Uncharacterized protein n=1 Tax=Physocladia obscura TaxID=109957 RepID=A0AAD5TB85_9FUNG|nr:hypothetical protein HK100_011720 [Physocladia obscura]